MEGARERHAEEEEEEGPCSAGQPPGTNTNSEFVGLESHGLPLLTCSYLSSSWCLSRLHTAST